MSANRLESRLQEMCARGAKGVAPFVTAGDGGLETTLAVLRALDRAGAACVELGVPFSDPIADGPVLQAASDRALAAGTSFEGVLGMLREFREGSRGCPASTLPVAIFSYTNPLLHRGWEEACARIAKAGGDALLVPDLPVEEGAEMRAAAQAAGLCPVFFVAPSTSAERLQAAAAASRGFLYAIGRFGVTGGRTEIGPEVLEFLARVRAATQLPLAVGFGIRTAAQVAAVTRHADLAIVGSALVQEMHERGIGRPDFVAAAAESAASFLTGLLEGVPA